jgi:hypothetical protein
MGLDKNIMRCLNISMAATKNLINIQFEGAAQMAVFTNTYEVVCERAL